MKDKSIGNNMKAQKKNASVLGLKLFIVIGILTAVLMTLSYKFFNNYNLNNTLEHNTKLVEQLSTNINDYLENFEKDIKVLGESKQIESIIESEDSNSIEKLLDRFEGYMELHEEVENIYFAASNKKMYLYPSHNLPDSYDPTERTWYVATIKAEEAIWSEPYVDEVQAKILVTLSMPVYSEDKIIGVLGIDLDLDYIGKKIEDFQLGETGYITLIDEDGNTIIHPSKELIGRPLPIDELIEALGKKHDLGCISYIWDKTEKIAIYSRINSGNFNLVGITAVNDLLNDANSFMYILIILGLCNTIITTFLVLLISMRYGEKQKNNIEKKQLLKENNKDSMFKEITESKDSE